jgi:hypothetical protein
MFAWITVCVLCYRPIPTKKSTYDDSWCDGLEDCLRDHDRWLRDANVIQSLVGMLTIPLTSAVCSSVAVIFVQRRQKELSLRQITTPADKGWTDLATIANLQKGSQKPEIFPPVDQEFEVTSPVVMQRGLTILHKMTALSQFRGQIFFYHG